MAIPEGNIGINVKKQDKVLILKLRGRLDAVSSPGAEKKVFDYISNGEKFILLDFDDIDYLSSAGMRMLLSTTKKLKMLSGKLIVCSVTPNVMDVLKMSGFDHVLELASSEEEALAKF